MISSPHPIIIVKRTIKSKMFARVHKIHPVYLAYMSTKYIGYIFFTGKIRDCDCPTPRIRVAYKGTIRGTVEG